MHGDGDTPATRPGAVGVGDDPPLLTQKIGAYRILGVVGSGGMGVVYEALDERLGRRVAIKRLHGRNHDLRILREAQALARLAHPNVVSVFEVFASDDRLCIVMELVAGRTLRAWIDGMRPSPRERLDALIQAGQGIAAAHAAGLVHRDLKPDNIMIGDDGRVRVMDFGLARAATIGDAVDAAEITVDADAAASLANAVDLLRAPVTGAGTLLGTPGYMAPEHYLDGDIDVRSDVFAFSVVLFETLHGRHPLALGDRAELRRATLGGEIVEVDGDRVPPWLDRVIRRGLATAPEARWPTMAALLAALADDPEARRRRRLRSLALVGIAALLAAGLTYGALVLARLREGWRAEEAAAARLESVKATIGRADAEGDASLAEAAFRAFVSDPAHRGTAAVSRAWRWRGARLAEAPEAAFAEAYVAATTPEDAIAALEALADVFRRRRDGDALARTAALLGAAGVDGPEVALFAFEASLWRGDLAGAAEASARPGHPQQAWSPLLTRLARTRQIDHVAQDVVLLPPGGEARVAAYDDKRREVLLLDPELREVGRWQAEGKAFLIDGTRFTFDQRDDGLHVVDLLDGAVRGRGPSSEAPFFARLYDADADGLSEVYFSREWPALGFRRWDLAAAHEEVAHRETDALESVLNAAVAGDLDGDGLPELAVAFGEWHAFDLRLFRGRADGELELLHQRRFGRIAALAIVRRGGRPLLVALSDASAEAAELFPEPPHTGAPAGAHFFAWNGGTLAEVAFVPLPNEGERTRFQGARASAAGDLDGDGDDDLALGLQGPGGPWILLLRQDDGGFDSLLVAGAHLETGGDIDGDGAIDLLAANPKTGSLIVLGVGDGRRGAPLPALDPLPPPPSLRDPLLLDRWRRADELRSLGLPAAAATSLYEAALVSAVDEVALAFLDRAAALFVEAERPERALEIDHKVQRSPEHAPAALARSATTLHRLGRYPEAEAHARALLDVPGRGAEEVELARALLDDLAVLLDPAQKIELAFDRPLLPEWQISTAGALRRDPTGAGLDFVIPAGADPIAALALDWDGGPIALDFEVEIEHLEYGACISLALADTSGRPWLGAGLCGSGGGGSLFRERRLRAGFDGWHTAVSKPWPSARGAQRWQVHLSYTPERRLVEQVSDLGKGLKIGSQRLSEPIPAGRHALVIGALEDRGPPSLAVGRLRRLTIHGARLAPLAPGDADRHGPARHLADGDRLAALAELDALGPQVPRAALLRLLAHAELADLAGVEAAAREVAAGLDDPALLVPHVLILREAPLAAAALRDAAGPRLLPTLRAVWEVAPPHRNDPVLRRRTLDALEGIEALAPTDAVERGALRDLLRTRALMREHNGDLERARQDLERADAVAEGYDERR